MQVSLEAVLAGHLGPCQGARGDALRSRRGKKATAVEVADCQALVALGARGREAGAVLP